MATKHLFDHDILRYYIIPELCLYSAVSLTLVREQCYIKIIYYYYKSYRNCCNMPLFSLSLSLSLSVSLYVYIYIYRHVAKMQQHVATVCACFKYFLKLLLHWIFFNLCKSIQPDFLFRQQQQHQQKRKKEREKKKRLLF